MFVFMDQIFLVSFSSTMSEKWYWIASSSVAGWATRSPRSKIREEKPVAER